MPEPRVPRAVRVAHYRALRAEGLTNAEAAARMGLSLHTTERYLVKPAAPRVGPRGLTLGQVAYGLGLPAYAIPPLGPTY